MKKRYIVDIGKRLLELRSVLGIQQKDMARAIGINPGYLSDIENGKKTNPGFAFLHKISLHYQVSLDYLVHGIGDDTAVISTGGNEDLLVTCDLMTEGIHFSLDYYQPEDIGWRILAANLSDIASMGGKPLFFTRSVAIPPHFIWNYSNPLIALFILLPFNLWTLIQNVRAAQRDERNWGYQTEAPIE